MGRKFSFLPLKDLKRAAVIFSSLLFFAVGLSLLAPYHYIFDLFSHFKGQYLFGAIILGVVHTVLKQRVYTGLCIAVAVFVFIDMRAPMEEPWSLSPPRGDATLKAAVFNQFLYQNRYDFIESWLQDRAQDFDLVTIYEAKHETVQMAERLKDKFPFQLHNPKPGSKGLVILSKYPLQDEQFITYEMLPIKSSYVIAFAVQPPTIDKKITFYAVHPPTPTTSDRWQHRNGELAILASKIKENDGSVIVLGDFNNTPYTPSFRSFLHETGLNYQSYGLLQHPTWPTQFLFPLFQIPIDHILYSDDFIQQNKYTHTLPGSDHKALIATFSERKEQK